MNAPEHAPSPRRWPRRGLYAVTPECDDDARLLSLAAAVLRGGAVALQYRSKLDSAPRRHARAAALHALCGSHGALFIVNDDIALTAAVGADGVHLGVDDAGIGAARAALGPGVLIGASCYDSLERARAAHAAGADYLAFGAFFASPTKPAAARADPSLLSAAAVFGLPRVAIGGIRLDNAPALIRAGADLLAVVSDLFGHPDPQQRSTDYSALFASDAPIHSPSERQ